MTAAQDYDSQLLESVSVRRRRLRDALLFGGQRGRRSVDERLGKLFAGIVIAAVLCAGCVGWSFISHKLIGKSPYGTSVQPTSMPSSSASSPASSSTSSPAVKSSAR
ncbi:hypothetical protein AB0M94_29290 [Streptomyces xanthochromogenes]|uniref:hypothetical protein n=1 Tax=Streptomyces TaxID=1883 RepID=UPI00137144EE|nr:MULTISPECIES: hypothetical protein [Streptomyces]MYV88964.1 hypothetical protein [Streptomyces sp. SID1034]GHB18239.1 hypothetical protein GCM10010331_00020 [Streptomyces xanthochromogenes]